MGRFRPIFSNFGSGELSPLMYGRVDFEKFVSGARVLLNYILRPHGPVIRRPGLRYISEVKDSTQFTRLLRFEFSTTQAYQIEAGNLYFRFYRNGGRINLGNNLPITGAANNGSGLIRITCVAHGLVTGQGVDIAGVGGVPSANHSWPQVTKIDNNTYDLPGSAFVGTYTSGGTSNGVPEVVTPYTSADLPQLHYVQSADTLYFCHPNYPVQKLTRSSDTSWTFTAVNFLPPATFESGFLSTGTLTLGATSGLGVSITLSVGDLLAADVGRMITLVPNSGGRAIIKTVATATTGTVDIVDTFASVGPIASGSWVMQGSPNTPLTPTVAQPIHNITTLNLGTVAGWRSTDVGRYVRVNRGVVRITKFTSTTSVDGELLNPLANITVSPGGSWSLEDSMWTAARGYPRAVAFMQQRLVFGGAAATPQAFWGSDIGQYEVFGLGPDDDDAYEFIIAANEVNTINWLVPARVLMMGTASGEFIVQGSRGNTNAAIGPNNVDVQPSTFWGSSELIQPLRIGRAVLFVTRTGTELREMIFDLVADSYNADDMLLYAEHLTKNSVAGVQQIRDMAYQRHPNSVVWAIRFDGTLLGLTYQREHKVAGWHRHITGPDGQDVTPVKGKFESVAVTPHWNGDRDVAFFIVNRLINGVQKRYVEYLDDRGGYYSQIGMDSALIYDGRVNGTLTLSALSGSAVTATSSVAAFVATDVGSEIVAGAGKGRITGFTSSTVVTIDTTRPAVGGTDTAGNPFSSLTAIANGWGIARFSLTGLFHLINETVQILGDGAIYPTAVVDSTGTVAIAGLSVLRAEIGLGFNSKLQTMNVEVAQQGTSQGLAKSWGKIWVRCINTLGMFVNGEEIPFRSANDLTDTALPLFSGDVAADRTAIDTDGTITVEQRQPLPQTVCAIFGDLGVGE